MRRFWVLVLMVLLWATAASAQLGDKTMYNRKCDDDTNPTNTPCLHFYDARASTNFLGRHKVAEVQGLTNALQGVGPFYLPQNWSGRQLVYELVAVSGTATNFRMSWGVAFGDGTSSDYGGAVCNGVAFDGAGTHACAFAVGGSAPTVTALPWTRYGSVGASNATTFMDGFALNVALAGGATTATRFEIWIVPAY